MYLKSKITLQYNDGMTGTTSSKVIGKVVNFARNGDCTNFGANFQYLNADAGTSEGFPLITQGAFELKTAEECQALFDAIKANLPDVNTVGEPAYEAAKVYEAFRLEMLQTFLPMNPDLTAEDIEIIEE